MILTRDSLVLRIAAISSFLTFIVTNFGLLAKIVPAVLSQKERIEAIAAIIAALSAMLMASPLPLSISNPMAGKGDPTSTLNPLNPKAKDVVNRTRRR